MHEIGVIQNLYVTRLRGVCVDKHYVEMLMIFLNTRYYIEDDSIIWYLYQTLVKLH